ALVGGCGSLGKVIGPPPAPKLYVLAPPPTALSALGPRVKWQLAVSLPLARANLDTARIALNKMQIMMDYYADAAWTDRLPLLVQDLLIECFEHSGKITGVARDTLGIAANYRIDTELRQFEAHYDREDAAPRVIVRIEAKLTILPERNIINSWTVTEEVQSQRNDIQSIVIAFNKAGGSALQALVDRTFSELPPAG